MLNSAEIHAKVLLNYHLYEHSSYKRSWISLTHDTHQEALLPTMTSALRPAVRLEKTTHYFNDLLSPSFSSSCKWRQRTLNLLQTFHTGCPRVSFPRKTARLSSCKLPWYLASIQSYGFDTFLSFTLSTYLAIVMIINAHSILFWQGFFKR